MNLDNLPHGENVADDINVVIEIPAHDAAVKYEVDKDSGTLAVDRFMGTVMFYPCNYGKLTRLHDDNQSPHDLYGGLLGQVTHFFEQYKVLESGKWVKVENGVGVEEAREEICSGIQRYRRMQGGE